MMTQWKIPWEFSIALASQKLLINLKFHCVYSGIDIDRFCGCYRSSGEDETSS